MKQSIPPAKHVLADSMKDLLRKKPIEKITTDEICNNAGVSRRNFYRHFSDKYDLLQWIYYEDFCVDNVHHEDWCIWDYFPAITAHLYSDRAFYANAFDGFVEWLRSEPCMPPDEYAATTQKKYERFVSVLEETLKREPAGDRTTDVIFRKKAEN